MTFEYADDLLLDCEEVVEISTELLWRQVPEHKWDAVAGKPASSAFGPTSIDKQMPSFARESKTSAQESRDWHQKHAHSRSAGVWACTSHDAAEMEVRVIDDSACPDEDDTRSPGHCYVDYRGLEKPSERNVRKFLLAKALERGEVETTDCLADEG